MLRFKLVSVLFWVFWGVEVAIVVNGIVDGSKNITENMHECLCYC